ncbi:MAG: hypothetical protein K2X93_14350 [Candidatus Obscuribacterales bacterium]|nr:hypothetical protein [Candidatus Obscuribacterales bacterium]
MAAFSRKLTVGILASALAASSFVPLTAQAENLVAVNQVPVPQAETAPSPVTPPVSLTSTALNQKGDSYKMSPDGTTWREYLETLRVFLSDGRTLRAPAASVIRDNRSLKDVQARVLDAGGARVWTFPGAQVNHSLIIQSAVGSAEGIIGAKATIVEVPDSVNITAAKIVRSFTTTTKQVKVGRRKVVDKIVRVEGPSLLAVAGLDRVSGVVYLSGYRPVNGAWMATTEPFSQIPSHFLQNLSGQASFSGNDLILSVSPQSAPQGAAVSGLPKPKSSAYQIVLKFQGGHFVLGGSPGKDMPLSIVSYFVQCLRLNRMDLAKAWLADPALASIPKYTKLIGKNAEPYKLVPMSQPPSGAARYRLVTYNKYDLIFDVGRVKKDLMIKGIFIAPPDSLSKSLSGTMIGATPPAPPAATETPTATPAAQPPEHHD